ncbi:hypothetical protein V1477_016893, partial [Vespula maculifrons]
SPSLLTEEKQHSQDRLTYLKLLVNVKLPSRDYSSCWLKKRNSIIVIEKWKNTIEVVSNESEKSMPRMEVFYGNEDFKLNYTLLDGRIFVNNEQY